MISDVLITDIVTLERPRIVIDESSGSKRETWDVVPGSENIPASIQPVSSAVRMEFASRQIVLTHRIYTRTDLHPKRGDRLRPNRGDKYYVITGFFNQAGRDTVYMIEAKEVAA